MDKICEKCGSPLDENGVCPKCDAEEKTVPEEVTTENTEEPTASVEPENVGEAIADPETQETSKEAEDAPKDDDQPSKFAVTAKQVWLVIRKFFTKDAVRTISDQYTDEVPIWSILLPAYAVIAAISGTATFNANGSYSSGIAPMIKNVKFGAGEVFFLNLFFGLITLFTMSIAVRFFIKIHKGDGHWTPSANLVTAAQLPIMTIGVFNILTGGVISGILETVSTLATCASYLLLFSGISKALGGKKPIWSFFLMIICVTVISAVITVFVASPIIFSSLAYSIMDSFG